MLSEGAVNITKPSNGGDPQLLCLPIEYINGWLFGIDIKRCKPEIRETLIMYKKECYQALYNYWNKPQQLALPEPEKKYTFEFTEYELEQLVWLWCGHKQMNTLLGDMIKPLETIGSYFTGMVISHHQEYRRQYKNTLPTIQRLIQPFKASNQMNWERAKNLIAQ